MDDLLTLVLRYALLIVMVGAAIAIFGEIAAMARGKEPPRAAPPGDDEA